MSHETTGSKGGKAEAIVKKHDNKASSKQVKELAAKARQETADKDGGMQFRRHHSERLTRAERKRNQLWKLSVLKREHRFLRELAKSQPAGVVHV